MQTKKAFDVKAWAQEYFQLGSEKVQKQLTQYLALASAKEAMPQELTAATVQQQLAWMTTQALDELASFVENTLQRLSGYNISTGHSSPETADEVVSQFRAGSSNSLQLWGDPAKALVNAGSLCNALGLTHSPATSVATCIADANHITHEILVSMAATDRKLYTPDQFEHTRVSLEKQARAVTLFAAQSTLLVVNKLP